MIDKLRTAYIRLACMYHTTLLLVRVRRAMRDGVVHRRRATREVMTDPADVVKALLADYDSVLVEFRPATRVEQVR